MPVVTRRAAATELLEHFVFIGRGSEDAAERFLQCAQATFALLASQPEMGKLAEYRSPLLMGMRSFPLRDFPKYLVFYRPVRDGTEVIRVIHGARDIPAMFET
ncbi:MAG: type II toxin-antitoxin system RelE/ParE family toxin [Terriglobia bacterium]